MFAVFDRIVFGMAAVRLLSAAAEFTAAILMLHFNRVETAFKINSVLATVGPVVLMTTTALGLAGLVGKLSPAGIIMVILGVLLIFTGIRHLR